MGFFAASTGVSQIAGFERAYHTAIGDFESRSGSHCCSDNCEGGLRLGVLRGMLRLDFETDI